jgi:hypothetical protein
VSLNEECPDPHDAVNHVASDNNGWAAYADCGFESSRSGLRDRIAKY